MLSGAPTESAHAHLRARTSVDTVCAMGTAPLKMLPLSTAIQSSHIPPLARGLLCAQLLARVLDSLAEPAIARHLAAHLIDAVDHGRVIAPAEGLSDLD
jgi:hypothetical protein